MKAIGSGLLIQVFIAIGLGVLGGLFLPTAVIRCFVTFSAIFGNFLTFFVPLLIIGLVASGIAGIGRKGGPILLLTLLLAYGSTLFSGFFTWGASEYSFNHFLNIAAMKGDGLTQPTTLPPYFTLEIAPICDVMGGLLLAFILGLGTAACNLKTIKSFLDEFKIIIAKVITKIIIPLLPIHIFGIFMSLTAGGLFENLFGVFLKLIIMIFVLTIILLSIQFGLAGIIGRRNPVKALLNMFPAWLTALGTQSSAVTIPVTLRQTLKNGVAPEVAEFTVPLCATIHLAGSAMKITACSWAIVIINQIDISPLQFTGFIILLGITMVAAPGVPGGAIMAAIGILQKNLGFDETAVGLMIALYIIMDGFGTACNVTGDGAIAIIVDRFCRRASEKSDVLTDIPPQISKIYNEKP